MVTSKNRRLAAILFADIVGYTALMQKDEQTASSLLRHFQHQLEKEVLAHNGQIVNFYGLCNEFLLLNKEAQVQIYAKKFQQWMLENPSKTTLDDHAFLAFYQKNYEQVIELLTKESAIGSDSRNPGILEALLGICYAKTGNLPNAEMQIKKVLQMDYTNAQFFGFNFYNKGLIETAMGKKEDAVNSLRQAIEAGATFDFELFKGDGLLQPLIGYPPFEALVKPKEIRRIIE